VEGVGHIHSTLKTGFESQGRLENTTVSRPKGAEPDVRHKSRLLGEGMCTVTKRVQGIKICDSGNACQKVLTSLVVV
jgi:hypothetical protein